MNNNKKNDKIIGCHWTSVAQNPGVRIAAIVERSSGIEGIDIHRMDCAPGATLILDPADGHILTVLSGAALLESTAATHSLSIRSGMHLYVPAGCSAKLKFSARSSVIHAAAGEAFARGKRLLVHDEQFLCATRFVLTAQYLSRRIFLNRDETLISKSGDPVAWFNTTMFDTRGLPKNYDGLEVFKMSYDYQSEMNVVYDVGGSAKVRFARHPYCSADKQRWSEWAALDAKTAYYLNESATGDDVETTIEPDTAKLLTRRNRHEIYIEPQGHVSLCCLFDPAPTGFETHMPGEYSAYAAVDDVVDTPAYRRYLSEVQPMDEMIQALSMAAAVDPNDSLEKSDHWALFESALNDTENSQQLMIDKEAADRKSIIELWRTNSR